MYVWMDGWMDGQVMLVVVSFFFLGASFPTRFSHTTAFPFFPFFE